MCFKLFVLSLYCLWLIGKGGGGGGGEFINIPPNDVIRGMHMPILTATRVKWLPVALASQNSTSSYIYAEQLGTPPLPPPHTQTHMHTHARIHTLLNRLKTANWRA